MSFVVVGQKERKQAGGSGEGTATIHHGDSEQTLYELASHKLPYLLESASTEPD